MGGPRLQRLAARQRPDLDGAVATRRSQQVGLGEKDHACHHSLVARQGADLHSGHGIPNLDGLVLAGGRQLLAVGAEGDRLDRGSVLPLAFLAGATVFSFTLPLRGTIAPNDFISIAEENGLIVPIGVWVLKRVCAQLRPISSFGRLAVRR